MSDRNRWGSFVDAEFGAAGSLMLALFGAVVVVAIVASVVLVAIGAR